MITIGEVVELLKKDIYKDGKSGDLKLFREREKSLKTYINLCFEITMQNINRPNGLIMQESYFAKKRVEYNIEKLSEYINYLTSELDKKKIEEFHNNQKGLFKSNYDIDILFLIHHSYYGSILTDILWADDITMKEAMELSGGKLKLDNLGKKLPNKIKEIEKVILPFFRKNKIGKRHYSTLKEAITCYHKKLNKGANLLVMTSLEGIVRDLGEFLIDKQGLSVDPHSKQYNSLDTFLRNINWKDDFEIGKTDLALLTGEYEHSGKRNFHDVLEKTNINLKTRLDFLRRRFKEDRNLILHGIESEYGKNWHLFVNFSALSQVYETVEYYEKKYK